MAHAAAANIVGGVVAGLVMIVAALVVMYIIDFIHRSYGLTLNIYNWDVSNGWSVVDWYSDNADINDPNNTGGTGQFKVANLPQVTNSCKGPDGFPIYTVDSIANYGTYTYANDNEWLEGLGVCMKVQNMNDPSTGFYLKYVVHRFKDNEIGLQGNIKNSMDDYYNGGWAPTDSYTVDSSIDGLGIPIKGITYSLSGEDSHLYSFDIHIGFKPSSS
ncbi:hypothetical protein F4779DRAFT_585533 [Xylariaceae sp. FL0662B]|nr:hypothetical protein F4779DRAFT_585533 [Xylariaceae sp. FL0662B]